MTNIFPGVVTVDKRVVGAEEAARRAVDLARVASRSGTFGVGGFLMRSDGLVIAEAINRVIVDGDVDDPTAHVERQLVDWYLDAKGKGLEVLAEDLVLVSSLDPCAMCAASIVSAGIRAVSVAEDPVSGVHKCGRLHYVPSSIRARAKDHLALFNSSGRENALATAPHSLSDPISPHTMEDAKYAFMNSLTTVRKLISKVDGSENLQPNLDLLLKDPTLDQVLASNVKLANQRFSKWGASVSAPVDRSLLVDDKGFVLLEAESASSSPTRHSIVELVRSYGAIRRFARVKYALHLPHQRQCSILSWSSKFDDLTTMLSLGAVGSSLEDHPLSKMFPAIGLVDSRTATRFRDVLRDLPPLYNDVLGISVGTFDHKAYVKRPEFESQ